MATLDLTIPGTDSATLKNVSVAGGDYWASLSTDIVFQANISATEMSMIPNVAHFVEQRLLQGKPRLQRLGTDLQELEVTVKFHFSIRPFKAIKAALNDAAANATVLTWVWGTGETVGDFVITKWKEKLKKTDQVGLLFATEIDLTLKEYATPPVADLVSANAKQAAFANKPLETITIPGSVTGEGKILSVGSLSSGLTDLDTQSNVIQGNVTSLNLSHISLARFKRDILAPITAINNAILQVNSAINTAKNIPNDIAILAATANMQTANNALRVTVNSNPTAAQLSVACNNVSLAAAVVNNESSYFQMVKSWFAPLHI